ncbi:MAG: histone deacetylase [Planctomycetaceae bacterium]
MPAPRTGVVHAPETLDHVTGPGHPETPARVEAVLARLRGDGLLDRCTAIAPRAVTDEELLRVHTAAYLGVVRQDVADGLAVLSTGDTAIGGAASLRAATMAGGALLAAVDEVCAGRLDNAFAVVRPPGHHATPTRGMGFCFFNSVAVAARHAQARHGIERVLVVDWDVHHGNGTQDAFVEDPAVLFFDTHQSPLYPGTGAADEIGRGAGEGFTINCPFPAGAGRREILAAYRDRLLPAADAFRPGLVLVSAGFDSRRGDPLGRFTLDDADFAEMTRIVRAIAERHAGGRLVSTLEGGYALDGLAAAAAAHVAALLGAT